MQKPRALESNRGRSWLTSHPEVYAMIDSLGDVGHALNRANPAGMRKIYENLRLEMIYDPEAKAVDAAIRPLGGVVRVSEGRVVHKPPADSAELSVLRGRLHVDGS